MKYPVEQIYYSNYSDKLKPGHENYWKDIEDIGTFMSLALEDYTIFFDGSKMGCRKFTSIVVHQYKEKFGELRIYLTLGARELVKERWKETGPFAKKSFKNFEEFYESCYREDCVQYRRVYLTVKRLFPHYWKAIYRGSDHPEFICETEEEFKEEAEKSEYKYMQKHREFVYEICEWDYEKYTKEKAGIK